MASKEITKNRFFLLSFIGQNFVYWIQMMKANEKKIIKITGKGR